MAQNDDWTWVVFLAIAGSVGYYLWNRYDLVDTEAVLEQAEVVPQPLPISPLPEKMHATITADGSEWSVDGTEIRGGRTARLAWLTEDHRKNPKVPHRETKTLYEMNCDRGSYVVRSVINYDAAGAVTGRWTDDEFTDTPDYMAPGTNMASVFRRACSDQVETYLNQQ